MTTTSLYQAYGLTLQSTLALPELPLLESSAIPDVRIVERPVPETLHDADHRGILHETRGSTALYRLPAVARYLIEAGSTIGFERAPGLDDSSVRAFLLTAAFGALMHERKLMALQACAVEIDGCAALIIGESGVGKSTLAAALYLRGARLISDDFTVIALDDQQMPLVIPGYPIIHLWQFALAKLGFSPEAIRQLDTVRPSIYKYLLPTRDRFASQPVPVKRVYLLEKWHYPEGHPTLLPMLTALTALNNYLYFQRFAIDLDTVPTYWPSISALAYLGIRQITRTQHIFEIDPLVDLLLKDMQS